MTEAQRVNSELLENFCQLVADDLELLARLHNEELNEAHLLSLKELGFPLHLGYSLSGEKASPVLNRLAQLVEKWPDSISTSILNEFAADFAAIYLNHTFNASPMESVWIDEENLAYQQAMFAVRDRYKAHGLEMENWRLRSDDHLVSQVQFIVHLLRNDPKEIKILTEIANFLDEHLLRWIDDFSQRVAGRCSTEFYGLLALLTSCYLNEIRDILAEIIDEPRPSEEEIEERMKRKYSPIEEVPMQFVPGAGESW